ncbi:hypothetical protein R5R35_012460 [Gryllus longicercus]|uniref:C2H2-type domain-containing protein n=1 Tax=Gryllus longicercus TaxID=2509291 RepID=A0AAN9Z119_9ORTH
MNQLLADDALGIDSYQNELSSKSTVDEEASNNFDTQCYFCLDCRGVSFENANDLEKHLVELHLKTAEVLLQRLTDATIRRLNQRKRNPRKGAFARKRSHSYLVPRVKGGKKGSLKLKLKVSGSDSNSFEVVPVQKILVGPGELYPLNGGVLGEVKTEHFLTEVEWEKSLEGSSEQPVVASSGERTLDEEPSSYEKENSVDSNKSNEDEPGDDIVNAEDVDDNKNDENGDLLTIDKEELDIPPSPAPTPSATPLPNLPSPSTSPIPEHSTSPLGISSDPATEALNSPSNEELESDFLPPVNESEFSPSPNMVEINNSSVADVRSPAFPTTSSPATPSGQPTPPSEQQNSQSTEDDENSDSQDLSNAEQLPCDDTSDGATSNNFVWTDVSANDDDIAGEESNSQTLEERDPLLLTDPPADQGGNLQGSPNAGSIDGSDQSILRGFLSDQNAERTSASVSGVSGLEGFNLGSEYISLERLGDNAVICDVCGERAADQAALQDHKFRAGHFKCSQPECGGVVYATADELIAHQQTVHGSQQYSQQNILNQSQTIINQQSAPVQQLVQQVQRLPVPQMSMQALNKGQPPHSSAMPQQLSSSMVTLIPSQQTPYQSAVCRPPPLYPAPAPNMMQQHQAPPPYPGHQPQHVMFPQPYPPHSQSFTSSPRQAMQMQPRPYSAMMQQMNQNTMRHQAPRVQVSNIQQRGLTAQNVGSPGGIGSGGKRPVQSAPTTPNKQRRMDMLIPDRHDDADCHVIAMQKRTESGPVITGVQGSGPAAQAPGRQSSQADSTINLTDSITLSVRGQNANPPNGGKGRNDANSVASLLATRGITVTPAGATGRGNSNQVQVQSPQAQHRQVSSRQPATSVPAPPPQPAPQPVTTLNLNSAISIIPTASARTPPKPQQLPQSQQPGGNFAVPQGRSANRPQQQAQVERPPRPPTVDLTGDGPPPPPALNPMGGRGRGRGRGGIPGRNVCQLCDKPFPTLDALNQHMVTHRPGKLPFRCNMCTAQYPTQQGLLQHRQSYHKESPQAQMNSELVLPVVDLKQPATVNRLNSLGVRHYIPLSQLSNQSGGILGLPIVVLDRGQVPSANVAALGAATILTLGPLRQLPR